MGKDRGRFLPHPLISIIFFLFILLYWLQSDIFLRHHDIGWHIAAGQQIRELGHIPEHDSWSFTAGNYPWLNISWLWDMAVSKVYDAGGFAPLVQVTIILGAAICAMLAKICLSLGVSSLVTLFGVVLVGLIFPFYQPPWDYVLSIAPQSVSLIFFLIFYKWLLEISLGRISRKLFLLPLLMLLWANIYGGFLLAFVLMGVVFFLALCKRDLAAAKYIFWLAAACVIAALVNPLGIHIIDAVMRSINGVGNANISEWMAFEWGFNLASAYIVFFGLVATWHKKEVPAFCRIVALSFLVIGLMQKRNFVYFLFASLPMLLISIELLLRRSYSLYERIALIELDMARRGVAVACLLLAAAAYLVVTSPVAMQKRFPEGVKLPAEFYPAEEIEYLRGRVTGPERELIFNKWKLGGYLIFSLCDKLKVFIDGRADTVYPPWVINMPGGHLAMLEKNKAIRFAIMPAYQPISQAYFKESPEWEAVFTGKVATVYERK